MLWPCTLQVREYIFRQGYMQFYTIYSWFGFWMDNWCQPFSTFLFTLILELLDKDTVSSTPLGLWLFLMDIFCAFWGIQTSPQSDYYQLFRHTINFKGHISYNINMKIFGEILEISAVFLNIFTPYSEQINFYIFNK